MPRTAAAPVASKFTKIRAVTLPVFKIDKGEERGFYFASPIFMGEKIDDKAAPSMVNCADLESGEIGRLILPQVMETELRKGYPDQSYVGKCFAVLLTRVPEKRYNIVQLSEIAPPEGFVAPKEFAGVPEAFVAAANDRAVEKEAEKAARRKAA